MDFIRRNLIFITAAILLACSIRLLNSSIKDPSIAQFGSRSVSTILFPIEKLHHEFNQSVSYTWNRYLWLLDVEEQRDVLQEKVVQLQTMNSKLLEFEKENLRLREVLSYEKTSDTTGITASVVSRNPSNWSKTITIDRGLLDGVKEGNAVVYGNGVVGQIVSVSKKSSKVLLISDPSSAVDVLLQDNRAWGSCEGVGDDDFLQLRFVEKQVGVEVVAGDRVIASGLDGVFPKGTLIGVVYSVEASKSSLFFDVTVRRAVDLKKLETVLILPSVLNDKSAIAEIKEGASDVL